MPKIIKKSQRVFCADVPANNVVSQYGSLKAGSPNYSSDPDIIQDLPAWGNGWSGAVIANSAPALQDLNSLFYVITRQLGYLVQTGVAEWDENTVYYIGSIVNNGSGGLIVSIADDHSAPISDVTKWQPYLPSLAWRSNYSYIVGDIVRNSTGALYASLDDSNLNNSLTDPTKWELLVSRSSLTGITAGSGTLDCQAFATFSKTGSASATNIGLNNMAEGQTVTVLVSTVASQGAITWKRGTDSGGTTDIKWSNQVVPTPTTTAGRHDRYIFQRINGIIFGSADMNCY